MEDEKNQRKILELINKIEMIENLTKMEYADGRINEQPAGEILRICRESIEYALK